MPGSMDQLALGRAKSMQWAWVDSPLLRASVKLLELAGDTNKIRSSYLYYLCEMMTTTTMANNSGVLTRLRSPGNSGAGTRTSAVRWI